MNVRKLIGGGCLVLWPVLAMAGPPDAQSRYMPTGPAPKEGYQPYDVAVRSAAQKVISNVPDYQWHHGCGPTSAGMVIGYWDGHGYDQLIPGNASTQTAGVDQAIASGDLSGADNCGIAGSGHFEDYSCPKDYWPTLVPDKSQTGGAHTSNSLGDFMGTSWSAWGNYYGWAWFSDMDDSLLGYVGYANATYGASYSATSYNEQWGTFTWAKYVAEIDADRPMVFLVDTNADGGTDHFVTAIGYRDTQGYNEYACLDTWAPPANVRWERFRGLSTSYAWGIYGATYFTPSGGDDVGTKWTQRPDLDPTGIDVAAFWRPSVQSGWVLADDFECTSTGAITEIRFWGSWYQDHPPHGDPGAVEFTLSIHEDIPGPAYSMPGAPLWMHTYVPGECTVELFADQLEEGWMEPPQFYTPFGDTMCWLYRCPGPDPAEFIQEGTDADPIIYWLDVQAIPLESGPMFGWKTSLDHWNDDAVWAWGRDSMLPPPPDWQELRYPSGHPMLGQSIDLAFSIVGESCPPSTQPNESNIREIGFGTANRYIGFSIKDTAPEFIRVTMVALDPPHDVCDGQQKWVGEPRPLTELSGETGPLPEPHTWVAPLQNEQPANPIDWSVWDEIWVYDEQIVPNSVYHVQAIDGTCDKAIEENFSAPLVYRTSRFGDIVGDIGPCITKPKGYTDCWTPPEGFVSFNDISATVDKFVNLPGAPKKARADVGPGVVDHIIDFTDIPLVVDAFRGLPYPYPPANKCP